MSRLINRLCGRVYGWFDSKDARPLARALPAQFSRRSLLALQNLEDRVTPANFTVTNTLDSGPGSLRQAILDANLTTAADTIDFDSSFSTPRTITITTGELPITENLTITGPGAGLLTLTNQEGRAFNISNAAGQIDVTIGKLTIANNTAAVTGSAIQLSNEKLTLFSVVVANNTTTSGGGAISANSAGSILTVRDSAIVNNKSTGAGGGFNIASSTTGNTLTLRNTTVSGNSTSTLGGGVYLSNTNANTSVSIFNSTITNNTSATGGGGIRGTSSTTTTITLNSSIVSGNSGPAASPDMFNLKVNSTRSAIGDPNGWVVGTSTNDLPIGSVLSLLPLSGNGGNTFTHAIGSATSPLINAGLDPNSEASDQRGSGYPRIVDGLVDIGAFELDATIPLATPGAFPTVTAANAASLSTYPVTVTYSSSVDLDPTTYDDGDEIRITGPNGFDKLATFVSAVPTPDLKNVVVTYNFNAPVGGWSAADVGLYSVAINGNEVATSGGSKVAAGILGSFRVNLQSNFKVTNTNPGGPGSLRQAILDANANTATADTITFDSSFNTAKVIDLLTALPVINDKLTITGPGSKLLTVQRSAGTTTAMTMLAFADTATGVGSTMAVSGIKLIGNSLAAVTTSDENVTLTDLNISGVSGASTGGGILVQTAGATLNLINSTISNNTVTGAGGGIAAVANTTVNITGSTIRNNLATTTGGGMNVIGSTTLSTTVSIDKSTFDSNVATTNGGGVNFVTSGGKYNIAITNSTLSNNTANTATTTAGGGGLFFIGFVDAGGFRVRNSTISGNKAISGGGMAITTVTGSGIIDVLNCTITNNISSATVTTVGTGGGGIAIPVSAVAPTINIESTIVSGNTAAAANGRDDIATTATALVNLNFSAVADPDGFSPSGANNLSNLDSTVANLKLGTLGFYGGTTKTHILGSGSTALEKGSNPAPILTTDQTGGPRVQNGTIDIGAYEHVDGLPSASMGTLPVVTVDSASTNPYQFTVTYKDDVGINFNTVKSSNFTVNKVGGGFSSAVTLINPPVANSTSISATYQFSPPGGTWDVTDNGTYTLDLADNEVFNILASPLPVFGGPLGTVTIAVGTTFTVSNTNDTGAGSLRQAMLDANADPISPDTIVFDSSFTTAKTIGIATALPTINGPLTIVGKGSSLLTLQRSNTTAMSMFTINNAMAVSTVSISGISVIGNTTTAINMTGDEILNLTDLKVSGVSATVTGAGISIGTNGVLNLTNSLIVSNSTTSTGGGINAGTNSVVTITNSTITRNSSGSNGGGIVALGGATVTISKSTIDGNTAFLSGGGLAFTVLTTPQNLSINECTISNNCAFSGSANATGGGGGIFFGGLTGTPGFLIRNSTLTGNWTTSNGGAIEFGTFTGTAVIQNSTITDNTSSVIVAPTATAATGGGGIAIYNGTAPAVLTLESTILSGNFSDSKVGRDDLSAIAAATINVDYSAIGDADGFTINGTNTNNLSTAESSPAKLQIGSMSIGTFGGVTLAHTLGTGSTAIGKGSNPNATATDQTGAPRPLTGNDIGATQRLSALPTAISGPLPTVLAASPNTSYTFTVTYTDPTAINYLTIDGGEIVVNKVGGGFSTPATLVSISPSGTNGSPLVATYKFTPNGGNWDASDNGRYSLDIQPNDVKNAAGSQSVLAGSLGTFLVGMPTTYTVTTTSDSAATVGSLRYMVNLASQDPFPDIITFSDGTGGTTNFNTPQTITFAAATGELRFSESLSIVGPGAKLLTLAMSGTATSGSRALNAFNASTTIELKYSGFTVTGFGNTGNGPALAFNGEVMSLTDMVITGNSAGGNGGGIYSANAGAILTILRSEISNNTAASTSGGGGGIYLTANSTDVNSLTMTDSTLSGNSTPASGGGFTWASGSTANCIAIFNNCTIMNNTAGNGGGLRTSGAAAAITLVSTIVSGNVATGGTGPDINIATVNSTNSAIGAGTNYTKGSSINDLPIGIPLGLQPLADNGGNTRTHAFDATSPLKHKGLNTLGLTSDARGTGFPRELATGLPDIGSYEFQPQAAEAASAAFTNIDKTNVATSNPYQFTVNYMAGSIIDLTSLDNNDVRVTGPNGYNKLATFVSTALAPNASNIAVTYKVAAPLPGGWTINDNGTYSVSVEAGQVASTANGTVPATNLGTFSVGVSAVYTVTNTSDSGPGSLREALAQANLNPSFDEIVFDSTFNTPQTITLTSGELLISQNVNLIGPAGNVTISGNKFSRVLNVDGPGNLTVNISNVNLVNASAGTPGGGLRVDNEIVTVTDSNITNNTGTGNGGGIALISSGAKLTVLRSNISNNLSTANGGGLDTGAFGAVVSIIDSTIANNASFGSGAGLGQVGGSVTLLRTTVSGNVAGNHSGGMYLGNLTAVIENSTFSGNTATAAGGAINFVTLNTAPILRNSTIVGNVAGTTGGALNRASGTANITLVSTIVAGNTAATGGPDLNLVTAGTVNADNSLIGIADAGTFSLAGAANLTGSLVTPLVPLVGPLSANGGFVRTHALLAGSPAIDTGSNPAALATDQRGQPRVNTGLTDIGAFERVQDAPSAAGGPFITIDKANAGTQNPYQFTVTFANESNINFSTVDDGDEIRVTGPGGFNVLASFVSAVPSGDAKSIAVTYQVAAPAGGWKFSHNGTYSISAEAGQVASTGAVTNPAMTVGSFAVAIGTTFAVLNTNDSGPGSLRQAILDANASPAPDTIIFEAVAFSTPQVIALTSGEMQITDNLTITGPGPKMVTLNANSISRHFQVVDVLRQIDVSISGMTLTQGASVGDAGGAIQFNNEKLTLTDMNISGNSTSSGGGGIAANFAGSVLTIIRSALTNNLASGDGGAIRTTNVVLPANVTIRETTISGNSAGGVGGGIRNTASSVGSFTIANSTITNNTGSSTSGGGAFGCSNANTVITLISSIVSGNFAPNGPGQDFINGTVNSSNSAIGSVGFSANNSLNDLSIGTPLNLLPLADNGGNSPTHAFVAGSFLINAGSNPNNDSVDQRGFARELPTGLPDIGAYERVPGIPAAVAGPLPAVQVDDVTTNPYVFTVTYTDDTAIDGATIGDGDIRVTGPNGFDQIAKFIDVTANGTALVGQYKITPPGGTWDFGDNGNYTVSMQANEVKSTSFVAVPAGALGTFNVGFAGTYMVTNANDSGPGSFRQALINSNSSINSPDTILFDTAFFNTSMKTIVLQSVLPGISDAVTMTGPGANFATISGQNTFRLLDTSNAPSKAAISISGLTLANSSTAGNGGAINIGDEAITLTNVVLTNNRAAEGGAISMNGSGSTLTITGSVLSNNTATADDGGAINVSASTTPAIVIDTSTLSGNSAASDGGGIYFVNGGSLVMTRSTVSGNIANGTGGATNLGGAGLYFFGTIAAGGFKILDSTISGNTHNTLPGGGIGLASVTGTVEISNSTIVGNKASIGGGIARISGSGGINITSSVIAGNTSTTGSGLDISFGSAGANATYSAVGTDSLGSLNAYSTPSKFNIPLGTPLLLGPLANNGGPTFTHYPASNSPLKDAGINPTPLTPDVDQIGNPRTDGVATDIGAVEIQPVTAPVVSDIVVNDGAAQRSRLTKVTVNFANPVDAAQFQSLGAVFFTRTGVATNNVEPLGTVVNTGNGLIVSPASGIVSSITITFQNIDNAGIDFGSLSDGRWQLSIPAAGYSSPNGPTDITLRRLFGNIDNDTQVGGTDFGFYPPFGAIVGSPFDFNNDGAVQADDFGQFGNRYGFTLI